MKELTRVFVGLGSNVGDRFAMLQRAIDALAADDEIGVVRVSSVYETTPVGPSQDDFLNAVVELQTSVEARTLLARFKSVERRLGRVHRERWGPREIDIDLLVYGDERIDEADLRVPHLGLIERAFVLVPLAEIAPDLEVPGAGTARDLLDRVPTDGVRRTDRALATMGRPTQTRLRPR